MLKILAVPRSNLARRRPRCRVYPGQRVSRKYRRAVVRRAEYRRLQKLIPNIARRRKVPELTVILEAVKYIDVLHSAIADRVRTIRGLQSAGADRKSITPDGRDVTNDTTQQVVFLSSRIYQQTTGGAPPFGRCLYPHPSSVALPETSSSCAPAHQRHCGRIQMRSRREADSSSSINSCHVKGVSSGEKLRMSVSAAGVMASRVPSSRQMLTTKRHLTSSDCFNLATNNNAAHR